MIHVFKEATNPDSLSLERVCIAKLKVTTLTGKILMVRNKILMVKIPLISITILLANNK